MKTICTIGGVACPERLNICCGTCGYREECENVCADCVDWQSCPDAETITDAMMPFESAGAVAIKQITSLMHLKKQLDEQEKELKEQLLKAMEAHGIKSFENDQIKMVYVAPTTKRTIDSARLKEDHPDIVKEYTKTSKVSASVRVTLKGGK